MAGGWPSIRAHLFFIVPSSGLEALLELWSALGVVFFDGKVGAVRLPPFGPSLDCFGTPDPSRPPLLGYLVVFFPFLAGPRSPTEGNGAEEKVLFYGTAWGCFPFQMRGVLGFLLRVGVA